MSRCYSCSQENCGYTKCGCDCHSEKPPMAANVNWEGLANMLGVSVEKVKEMKLGKLPDHLKILGFDKLKKYIPPQAKVNWDFVKEFAESTLPKPEAKEEMKNMRERSGSVDSDDPLVSFLYILMRDYVHPGDIENIMLNQVSKEKNEFTNGWLAEYAKDLAERLKN